MTRLSTILLLQATASAILAFLSPTPTCAQSVEDRVEALHAQASAAEASGELEKAAGDYEAIIKLDPSLAPAYNNLGALRFKQGDFPKAIQILQRGLKVDPHMSSAAALLGIALYQTGDYAKARPYLEASVKARPDDSEAQMTLVNDLTKLNLFSEAAAHLQSLAKRQPDNQRIWYLLGRVYMQLSEQALANINRINPNSVWAHQISAELMESMKNNEGAITEWKKAIEAEPAMPGLHYQLGDLYWTLSQWDNAEAQFRKEQQIDPNNCRVDWKLGDLALQRNSDYEAGLAAIDKSLARCPELTEARADKGRLLLKLHRESEALPELQTVEKVKPDDSSIHFYLAQAYRASGKSLEAASELKTFTQLDSKARAAQAERAAEVINATQQP